MKIMTVVGTRPELIRLSRIIPLLDQYCDHIFVHTGQNYDPNLKDIIFESLDLRDPDYLGSWWKGDHPSIAGDISNVLKTTEDVIKEERPDKLLILGDTNSGLSAIIAKRYGVKVYHMEAGNRCFNDIVPEEINRRIIDHCTDIWMPYTERSRQYLMREGVPQDKIFVTGNPICEVLEHYSDKIEQSQILNKLKLKEDNFYLVTMHRSENVDNPEILDYLRKSFYELKKECPVVISVHPHTRMRLNNQYYTDGIILSDPFNFIDFVNLEKSARCVLTDSGTVQEECSLLGVPNVIIRTTNERLETLEHGCNIICGYKPDDIVHGVNAATGLSSLQDSYDIPNEYERTDVSVIVAKIILGVYP
jgi:UDP-N-acetylglucosamine 2-epimerase (non-hydrolysing)